MDRLAHVLKSPLQLIRNSDPSDENYQGVVQEQVDRMLGVVESGLTRARLDGRAPDILGQPVPVRPVLERCDREGIGAYLESSNPRNIPFYHRLGFEVVNENWTPDNVAVMTGMWRAPR